MASASDDTLELVPFGSTEHGLGVDHAESIGAAVHAGNAGRFRVGLAARPIALQLAQVLERGHRSRPSLNHTVHRAIVRLFENIPAGVGDDVHLESLIERGERRTDDAYTPPQACENDQPVADLLDPLSDARF